MSTITDVARLAGVSKGTVSRVINGAENVNPETRSRVESAIAHLNYRPNVQARSLRSKRTHILALVIPELTNYFWTSVARGVQDACEAQGYNVFLSNTAGRSANYYIDTLEAIVDRVDGIILTRSSESVLLGDHSAAPPSTTARRPIPLVFVGQSQAFRWQVDNVYSDSVSASYTLTQHLIRLGHQHIAIITGRQRSSSARDRVAGYCFALAQAGLPIQPHLINWGEYDRQTARQLTLDLLAHRPSAIVAASNEIAIGCMYALEQSGLRVPDDMAVVCLDDFYPDSRFAPLMTVAAQLPYDLGVNAVQLLLSRLRHDDYLRPRSVVLPTRLIVRQSCGSANPVGFDSEAAFDYAAGQLTPALPEAVMTAHSPAIQPFVSIEVQPDRTPLAASLPHKTVLRQIIRQPITDTPTQRIINRSLYCYALEREPNIELLNQQAYITPEDQVEFAERVGMMAVMCRFPGLPTPDNRGGFDFPPLTGYLDFFDRYLRAAQNRRVAIAADFRAIVADTLHAAPTHDPAALGALADRLSRYQRKVVQLICDRFADELAFALFSDTLADEQGLCAPADVMEQVFLPRLQHLIQPALEHDLPAVLYTPGQPGVLLPALHTLGFAAVYPAPLGQSQQPLRLVGVLPAALLGERGLHARLTAGDDLPYTGVLHLL